MLELAVDFLKGCRGKTIVVYDTDGDGIGAAVILAKTFKRLFGKYPEVMPRDHGSSMITEKMLKRVRTFDNIIFLDIAADDRYDKVLQLAKKSRILIIDHHQMRKNLNGHKSIVHFNSVLFEKSIPPSQYTASKMVYDVCSRLTNVEDWDWLAGMGIVNDNSKNSWKHFMEKIYRKYKITPKNYDRVNDIITSTYMMSKTKDVGLSFKACLESDSPSDIISGRNAASRKLRRIYDVVEEEIRAVMKRWKSDAEILEDKELIILELKTGFSISSVISTKISFERPNYTVLVARKDGRRVSISLRRQDGKVNCGLLAKKLTRGLKNSRGGGHGPAAGIGIMKADWKILRKRVQNSL